MPLREAAPAKLNLDLRVVGRRPDGYHLLDSLVVFADLGDELTFAEAPDLRLELTGPMAGELPAGGANLVRRAAEALAAAAGVAPPRAAIRLDKRLPVAAGLGGGSADAAATLRGLGRQWGVEIGPDRLAALALGLGADVPVCLGLRPARVRGVGERLDPVRGLRPLDLVLANPRRPLATAAVFRALRLDGRGPNGSTARGSWLASRNDLEAPARALLPLIGEVLAALAAVPGCALARMSGSGPTCFGLFPDAAAARAAALGLRARHPGWWIAACRTLAAPP